MSVQMFYEDLPEKEPFRLFPKKRATKLSTSATVVFLIFIFLMVRMFMVLTGITFIHIPILDDGLREINDILRWRVYPLFKF